MILFLVSFFVSFLPEQVKTRWLSPFNNVSAHIVGGAVEALTAVVLLLSDYLTFLGLINEIAATHVVNSTRVYTETELRGVGLVGFFSYIARPWTWILFYHIVEGCVRAIDAVVNDGTRGSAAAYVIFRTVEVCSKYFKSVRRRVAIGPKEGDKIRSISDGAVLIVESVEEKPWWEHQVLRYKDIVYQMKSRRFIKMGRYFRYVYRFERLPPSEIIRGTIVDLDSPGPK